MTKQFVAAIPERALLDAIERVRAVVHSIARGTALPDRFSLPKALEKIGAAQAPAAAPQRELLERARAAIVGASKAGDIMRAERRMLRLAPWLLWTEKDPLATLPGLLDAVVQLAGKSVTVLRSLIEAWLASCGSKAPGLAQFGYEIQKLLQQSGDMRLEIWRKAGDSLKLFDVQEGPRAVALAILRGPAAVSAVLTEACLDTPLRAVGGYARLVHGNVLTELSNRLSSSEGQQWLARGLQFILLDRRLRFDEPEARGTLADALLAPWINNRPAAEPAREAIQKLLLQHIGDPRTKPARWSHANKSGVNLMRGWLSRASILAFFDVIADHADPSFIYRRAFWTAYLTKHKDVIGDAWIALGSNVHAAASSLRDLDGAYARLRGASSDHSVLLFRIGSTIFSEWSHSGKLRAWPDDWKNAPKLYEMDYQRADVVGKGLPFPPNPTYWSRGSSDGMGLSHINSHLSYWQGSAAELIARRAGVRLEGRDWMPK